jgi:SMP-30/Gluconolactonase/LRE-like region
VKRGAALALAGVCALACARPRDPILDCTPAPDARPICGFRNPEDLALLPKARALVVSQLGSLDGAKPGSLVFFDLESESLSDAFPAAGSGPGAPRAGWGEPDCPGAPGAAFSPHGLDLASRPDGALELLVVNHGGRESVELFEVTDAPDAPALAWCGCAIAPAGAMLNDVAALPDGGFVATDFLPKAHPTLWSLLGLLRISTGEVLEWQPGRGFRKLAGTEGPLPNGIAVSRDGETLYVDEYLADEVRKISRRTGELLGSAEVASPDNLNWSPDGKLLVASHDAPMNEIAACGDVERGQCPFHFSIVLLDPERMEGTAVYENAGPPMGAGTSALRIGDELYIGSFAGDRLLRVTLPAWVTKSAEKP